MSFETTPLPKVNSIYRMRGEQYLVVHSSEDHIRLEARTIRKKLNPSPKKFAELLRSGELTLMSDVAMPAHIPAVHNLSEPQKKRFDKRRFYLDAVMAETNGNLSRIHFKEVIEKAAQAFGDNKPPSYATIVRWRNSYLSGDRTNRALLDRHVFIKKREDRLDKSVEKIIEMVVEDVLLKPERPCERYVHKLIQAKVREYSEILGEENYLRPPSLNTVRARIDRLDVMYKIERRHGKYAAMKRNQHGGKIYVGDCIGERVEMDSQIVDVLVWDEMHGVTLRPRLTLVMDTASRCVLGWNLSLNNVSAAKSMAALRDAMTHDDFCETKAIPHKLYVDNGCEFVNQALTVSCDLLGITPVYCSPKSPNQKPHVERLFKTFNDGFFHNLRGTTKSNPAQRGDYASQDEARLRIEDLRLYFRRYVHEVYHLTEHSSLNMAPLDKWRELTNVNQPRTLAASETEHHFFIPKEVTINHGRVRAFNIEWTSPGLPTIQEKVSRSRTKRKVKLMINPDSIGIAYVLDPANPHLPQPVRCIEPEIYHGWSLRQWRWVQEQDRANAKGSSLQDSRRLSRALIQIQEGLTQATKYNKDRGKRKRAAQQSILEIQPNIDKPEASMRGIIKVAARPKRELVEPSTTTFAVSSISVDSASEPSLEIGTSPPAQVIEASSRPDTISTTTVPEPILAPTPALGDSIVESLDDGPLFSSSVFIRKKHD